MGTTQRIFTAVAVQNAAIRQFVIEQSDREQLLFEFLEMAWEPPFDSDWRDRCRTLIVACDGFVGLIGDQTASSERQVWQITCAREERKPILLMHVPDAAHAEIQTFLGMHVNVWSWTNLRNFMESTCYLRASRAAGLSR